MGNLYLTGVPQQRYRSHIDELIYDIIHLYAILHVPSNKLSSFYVVLIIILT